MTKRKTDTELKKKVDQMNAKPPVVEFEPPSAGKIALRWLLFLIAIAGIVTAFKYLSLPELHLSSLEIIILSFSCAFVFVYVLKWGSVKPFNCVTCMSGWFSLIFGCWCIGWHGIIYMPIAMTFGALYQEIRMRYL